jgi:hypothetical protein
MNKKIVSMVVFGLLIAATALPVAGIVNEYNSVQEKYKPCSTLNSGWYLQWSQLYGGYRTGGFDPVGDIDEDGINEIIICGFDQVDPGVTRIMSYDDDLDTYIEEHSWSCPGFNVNIGTGVSILDLDNDGNLEFCMSWYYSNNNGIYAYDWDGTTLTQLDIYNGTGYDAVWLTTACDYDEDGDTELIIGNDPGSGPGDKHVTALGWDNENDEFIEEAFHTFTGYENKECTVRSGDTDNDGSVEIIATCTYSTISDTSTWALNWNEDLEVWEEDVICTDYPDNTPLGIGIGDLNGNGIQEIAIGNFAGTTAAWLYEWNGAEYDEIWYKEFPDEGRVHYAITIGDADNDGENELCIATNQVHIYQWNGTDFVEEALLTDPSGVCVRLDICDYDTDGKNELKTCTIPPDGSEYIYKRNNPPEAPTIDGPTEGKKGEEYEFHFVTTDIEGHDVEYWIDWGDNEYDEWIGPYPSGEEIAVNHTWDKKDNYTIKAKARDIHGVEGEWSELFYIMIPRNRATYNTFFQSILERFPNTFPILKYLIKLVNNQY